MKPRFSGVGPRIRLIVARRPWIRWLIIFGIGLLVALMVSGQLQRIDTARAAWSDQSDVWVAAADHSPGDMLVAERRTLPRLAIPPAAVDHITSGATARQQLRRGEVIVDSDVTALSGPAAVADVGQVVVPVSDPLLTMASGSLSIGVSVMILSEGIVLASDAHIAAIDGDVIFVAVDVADAASVAAAAQVRAASIVFPR
jgi:hypothetical protein